MEYRQRNDRFYSRFGICKSVLADNPHKEDTDSIINLLFVVQS